MKRIKKKIASIASGTTSGPYTVIKFIEDETKLFDCIPDLWFADENKDSCYWPPSTGKNVMIRALKQEVPDGTWKKFYCEIVKEGFATYSAGRALVRQKCLQVYNTSSAEEHIEAAKFRRQHPGLSFDEVFIKKKSVKSSSVVENRKAKKSTTSTDNGNKSKDSLNNDSEDLNNRPNSVIVNNEQSNGSHSVPGGSLDHHKNSELNPSCDIIPNASSNLVIDNNEQPNGSHSVPGHHNSEVNPSCHNSPNANPNSVTDNNEQTNGSHSVPGHHNSEVNPSCHNSPNASTDGEFSRLRTGSGRIIKRRRICTISSSGSESSKQTSKRQTSTSNMNSNNDSHLTVNNQLSENTASNGSKHSVSNQSPSISRKKSELNASRHNSSSADSHCSKQSSSSNGPITSRWINRRSPNRSINSSRSKSCRRSRSISCRRSTGRSTRRSRSRSRRRRRTRTRSRRRSARRSSCNLSVSTNDSRASTSANHRSSATKVSRQSAAGGRQEQSSINNSCSTSCHSTILVQRLIRDVRVLSELMIKNHQQNERRLARLEVTVNKTLVRLGDITRSNAAHSVDEQPPPNYMDDSRRMHDEDTREYPGEHSRDNFRRMHKDSRMFEETRGYPGEGSRRFSTPRQQRSPEIPIYNLNELSDMNQQLKSKEFFTFLINQEKEFCVPSKNVSNNVVMTAYLKRFITVRARSLLTLKDSKGGRGLTLFSDFYNVYRFLTEVMQEGYKYCKQTLTAKEAHEALRIVWGRSKQLLNDEENKRK